MTDPTAPQDRWYIDIRGQIRPISSSQILQGLIDNEIKVIFRISRDRQNWNAICNETYFDEYIVQVIKALTNEVSRFGAEKAQQPVSEQSGFHNIGNLKSSINEQLQHATKLQELNVAINTLRRIANEIASKRKVVIDLGAVKPLEDLHPDDQNEVINAPSFWAKLLEKIRSDENRTKLIVSVSFLTIAFGLLIGTKYVQYQREKAAAIAAEQARALLLAKVSGEYEKAIKIYESVENPDSLDSKTLMAVAEAQIETKKYDQGITTLKRLLRISTNEDERARAESMLGLIAMRQNDLVLADQYYLSSLKTKSVYSTLFNLAVIKMRKNDPAAAEPLWLEALKVPGHLKSPVILGLFETAWLLDLKDQGSLKKGETPKYTRLDQVKSLLDQITEPTDPFQTQILAAQIALASIENKSVEFDFLVKSWITLDPRSAAKLDNSDVELDYELTTWNHIYNWCVEVYKNPTLGSLKSAFFAGCVARGDAPAKALPYAQYAFDNSPGDLSLRSFLGLLSFLSDNMASAKKILRGGDYDSSPLALKVLTEICAKIPDNDCGKPSKPIAATKNNAPQRKPTQHSNKF